MRVRYYADKNAAAIEYNALTDNGYSALLCGPVPYLMTQTSAGKDTQDNVYVVVSEFDPPPGGAKANVVIQRAIKVDPATGNAASS